MYLAGDETQGVSVKAVLEQFGRRRTDAIRRYREYISEGMGEGHREEYYEVIDQRFLGDEEFAQDTRVRGEEPEEKPPVEVDLEEIVKVICSEFGMRAQLVLQREKGREISQVR